MAHFGHFYVDKMNPRLVDRPVSSLLQEIYRGCCLNSKTHSQTPVLPPLPKSYKSPILTRSASMRREETVPVRLLSYYFSSPPPMSSEPPLEQLLGVLAKSVRAAGFLLPLYVVTFSQISIANRYIILHTISSGSYGKKTYCLVICLCLKPASFWLAGLRIASDGLM